MKRALSFPSLQLEGSLVTTTRDKLSQLNSLDRTKRSKFPLFYLFVVALTLIYRDIMMLQLFAQALPATQRTARNFLGRTTRSYSFLYYSPAFKLSARPLNRVSAISFSRIRDVDDDDSFRAPPRPRREGSTFRDRARGRDDDSGRTAFRERSRGREEDGGRRDFDDGDRRAQRVRDLKERKVTSFARRGGDSGMRREYKEESKRSAVGQRIIASDEDYDDEASDDVSEPVAVQRNPRSRTGREEEGERRVNPADRVFGRRGEVVSDVSSIDDEEEEESAAVTDSWARDRRRPSSGRPSRDGDGNRRNDRRSVRSSGGRGDLSRRDGRDDWNRRPNPRGRGGDVSSDRRPDWRDRGSKGGDRRRGEESSSRREAWRDVKEEEDKEPVYGRYDGDHLYGVSPVLAALKNKRRKISELIVQEGKTVAKAQEREIVTLAKELGIPTREFEKHDLNMMSGNRPHQGFVLRAQPLDYVSLDKTPLPNHNTSSSNRLILALDEVMDPQNLGALLRTCHYLGCSTVVVSEKNSAPLSAVVSKASSGAMELMTVYSTKNMMTLLDRAKDEGWLVVGTAMKGKTCVAMGDVPCDRPVLLVLGNEGYGLRTNVQTRCDYLVNIPSAATTVATSSADVTSGTETSTSTSVVKEESERDDSLVDSLNVSVTGGILLHYFLNRSG